MDIKSKTLATKERRRKTEKIAEILFRLNSQQRREVLEKIREQAGEGIVSRATLDRIVNREVETLRPATLNPIMNALEALDLTKEMIPAEDFADGIPISAGSDYEKGIVDAFSMQDGEARKDFITKSHLSAWPDVEQLSIVDPTLMKLNPIPEGTVGRFRGPDDRIFVEARTSVSRQARDKSLTFLEAGPRAQVCFPVEERLHVGILVSGGIAPGINAIIDGIVERHELYQNCLHQTHSESTLKILGYNDGLEGLLRPRSGYKELTTTITRPLADRAGSLIGTSRLPVLEHGRSASERKEALQAILKRFSDDLLDAVYILGGDGTMKAAHALHSVGKAMQANEHLRHLPAIIAVPKTMDNDVLWLWQALGFQAAVARATEFVRQLYTEASSNPRLCVVQLYGSDSGFMVSHAALASGVCDVALIPEMTFSMRRLSDHIKQVLRRKFNHGESPHGMILMAETSIPEDVEQFLGDEKGVPIEERIGLTEKEKEEIRNFLANNRRVHGQTPDDLRSGGLKIISKVLERDIHKMASPTERYWCTFRVFTNQPRHLIRAIAPTGTELIFGHRLGTLAVDTAMAGYTDCMISQWLTEYVVVPLSLVVLGRKRVRKDGIFWRSVITSTNQPDKLAENP